MPLASSTKAHVSIVLDGVEAQRVLNALKNQAAQTREEMAKMEKEGRIDTKEYKELQRTLKSLEGDYAKNTKQLSDLDFVMKNLSSQTSRQLTAALKTIATIARDVDTSTEEGKQKMEELRHEYDEVTKQARKMSLSYVDVEKTIQNLGTTSSAVINNAIAQLREELSHIDPTTEAFKRQTLQVAALNAELDKRKSSMTADNADNVYNSVKINNMAADRGEASVYTVETEHVKEALAYYEKLRETMDKTDAKGLENVNKRILTLKNEIANTIQGEKEFQHTLDNLQTADIDQLRAAQQRLAYEIEHATGSQEDFKAKCQQLASVKGQIDSLTKSFEKQGQTFGDIFRNFASYVGLYSIFDGLKSQVSSMISKNLEFSDTLSDIRKTTLMSEEAVGQLSDRLKELDTRTAVIDVQKLAYEAGKLGITGVANVSEFVKAADQVNIALGEQLGGLEAITELMKVNQVLGVTSQYGIQDALLKTGSAINYLSQTSTSTGGAMTDFTSRLAGIAGAAHLSIQDVLGLSSASDALKQSVEVSATAFNKLIAQMFSKTKTVADAVGVEFDKLKEKLEMGDTMDALLMVLDGINKKGGLSETAPIMKDLGSDGARMIQVFNAMATNVDFVEERVRAANKAFKEGTSVTNEYNIKNENAIALWERLKNNIEKLYMSASNSQWLKDMLLQLQDLPKWISRMAEGLAPVKVAFDGIVWSIGHMTSLWAGFIAAFSVQKLLVGFTSLNLQVKSFKKGLAECATGAEKLNYVMKSNVVLLAFTAIASAVYMAYDYVKALNKELQADADAMNKAMQTAATDTQKLAAARNNYKDVEIRVYNAHEKVIHAVEMYGKSSKEAAEAQKELHEAETDRRVEINNFNANYSQYLGYQLAETANYKEMEKAIDAVNAKLRTKALLNAKEERQTEIIKESAAEIETSYNAAVNSMVQTQEGMTETQANKNIKSILANPEKYLKKKEDGTYYASRESGALESFEALIGTKLQSKQVLEGYKTLDALAAYLNKTDEQNQRLKRSSESFDARIEADAQVHEQNIAPEVQKQWAEIESFVNLIDDKQKDVIKEASGELRDKRRRQVEQFLESARLQAEDLRLMTDADSQKRLEQLNAEIERAEAYIQKQPIRVDPIVPSSNDAENNEALRRARDSYKASIEAVEAYYQMQRQAVNDSYEKQEIDLTEREARMREIEQRLLQSRSMARQRVIGEISQDEWEAETRLMQNLNRAGDAGMKQMERIIGVDMKAIGDLLKQLGSETEFESIIKQIQDDLVKAQDLRIKRIQEIEKMLLGRNTLNKLTSEYEKTLRELGLISDRFMEQGETDFKAYFQRMMDIAKVIGSQAGNIDFNTDDGVQRGRELMMQAGMSDDQVNKMSPTEVQAFFYQSYKYAQDYADTSQRLAKQTLDAWETTYKIDGDDKYYDDRIRQYQQMADIASRMEKYGLSEAVALERQLDAATAIYAKEKARLDQKLEKAHGDRRAAENISDPNSRASEISKADQEIAMVEQEYESLMPLYEDMMNAAIALEDYNHRWVVSMKDAFVELGEQMVQFKSFYSDRSDNIWDNMLGSKEDRQKAFGDFVDSMKKATRTAIMEKVKQRLSMKLQDNLDLAWRKMFLSKEAAEEQIQQSKKLAQKATYHAAEQTMEQTSDAIIEGQNEQHNQKVEGQDTEHTIKESALSEASGVAKAFGDLGPIAGAVAVAMITAVIGSFLTMALNAVGGGKKPQQAATKTKLVSGMLSYDVGNATDVLADNGRHYSAVTDYHAAGLLTQPTITTVQGAPSLVAEEGPELVVGRATTRTLMMDYPGIVQTILNIERHHRRAQAHHAYAIHAFDDGNAADLLSADSNPSNSSNSSNGVSEETLQALVSVIAALDDRLATPIEARISNVYGKGGAVDTIAQGMASSKRLGDLDSVKRLFKNS